MDAEHVPFGALQERLAWVSRWPLWPPRIRRVILSRLGINIGLTVAIMEGVTITGPRLYLGSKIFINRGCFIDSSGLIRIGSDVSLGCEVAILATTHGLGPRTRRAGTLKAMETSIGDGAWLGARVTVLPGVTIGAGVVVAAGALVAHNLPANGVYAGVPAKIIRHMED